MAWQRRLGRELGWLTPPLLLFLGLHGLEFVARSFDSTGAPWWQRLLLIEDACSYGMCILLPVALYTIARPVGLILEWREERRRRRADDVSGGPISPGRPDV
jgi:hypothetical protein